MTVNARVLRLGDRGIEVPPSVFDHDGFRAWVTSDEFPRSVLRATFVEGEVQLDMSPESIESHNKIKTEVTTVLNQIVKQEDLGELYSDRTLLTHVGAGLSCEPDMLFVSWSALETNLVCKVGKANRPEDSVELEGSPDLVVEIVSDSSVQKDLVQLPRAYARAGVSEYWLADARGAAIRFEIFHLADGAYRASAPPGEPQESRVFRRRFVLTRRRNRAGFYSYDLKII